MNNLVLNNYVHLKIVNVEFLLTFNDMYELAFLIVNDASSPQSSNDLWRNCFIKLISYLDPLNDNDNNNKCAATSVQNAIRNDDAWNQIDEWGPMALLAKRKKIHCRVKAESSNSDSDGMGSIPAIPTHWHETCLCSAMSGLIMLCHELCNGALPRVV